MPESTCIFSLSKRKENIPPAQPPLKAPRADDGEFLHVIANDMKSGEHRWYVLDVKHGKLIASVKMPDEVPLASTAVAYLNRLYILGGYCLTPFGDPHSKSVFCFDLDNLQKGWMDAPEMSSRRFNPSVVAFNGKIYAFGGSRRRCFAEVFDIIQGSWAELKPPSDCPSISASRPVIVDSCRSQILVHRRLSKSLYAYNVADESWDCLIKKYDKWPRDPIVVDGVLYSLVKDDEDYYTLSSKGCSLRAYDLDENKELHIECFFAGEEVRVKTRGHLYHLSSNKFCLVGYDEIAKCIEYVKFSICKCENSGRLCVVGDPASKLVQTIDLDIGFWEYV